MPPPPPPPLRLPLTTSASSSTSSSRSSPPPASASLSSPSGASSGWKGGHVLAEEEHGLLAHPGVARRVEQLLVDHLQRLLARVVEVAGALQLAQDQDALGPASASGIAP
jgi:hypothetical protein